MLLAAFILSFLVLLTLLPISFQASALFNENGFSLSLRVRLAYLITVFGWDSDEEGLDFLFRKKARKEKKKNTRLKKIMRSIFHPGSILNLKGLTVSKFEARGVIATSDAARTAIVYGSVWAVLSTIVPFLKPSKVLVDFYPDFEKKRPDFIISCIIRVRIIHIIYLIANIIMAEYVKGRWNGLWNRIPLKN